ncbi:MAG: phosphoribosylformylglycinamidine synthase subunit PurS [Deferribacterota bacterium]|nr:phosphoribosylformylglycinamidine synthase subunit PurS [Deferribacterota bacterium]
MKYRVFITRKKGVLDPEGQAIKSAIDRVKHLNMDLKVNDVRVGKIYDIEVEDKIQNKTEALDGKIERLVHKILINPIIEDYRIEKLVE